MNISISVVLRLNNIHPAALETMPIRHITWSDIAKYFNTGVPKINVTDPKAYFKPK
jgi:hypothetical protein